MSVWTHVAAVFRIDGFRDGVDGYTVNCRFKPNWDKVTGKAIYDGDWCTDDDYEREKMERDWKAYRKHPSRFMPTGSEGSLQRLVWNNPDAFDMARHTVTIFGDLRDYEDYKAIEEWFRSVCEKCYVRQAICHCDVSGDVHTFVWGKEEE